MESTIESIGRAVSWLSIVLVMWIGVDVVLRYVFDWSSSANQEMEWHLFATLFLLGSAYALKHDKHVRVDVFYSQLNNRQQALVDLLGTLVLLLPFSMVIVITSLPFALEAYQIGESSPEPGGLPYRFVVKSMIPISGVLLFAQGLALILKSWVVYFKSAKA